jgi:hypothetical protein
VIFLNKRKLVLEFIGNKLILRGSWGSLNHYLSNIFLLGLQNPSQVLFYYSNKINFFSKLFFLENIYGLTFR